MRRSLLVVLVLLVGCGNDDDPRLVVSAASSMTEALTTCSQDFSGADVRLSFAGSDELAAQIRQGVKPDVYAAANTKLPEELNKERLLSKPAEFATNELVIAAGDELRAVKLPADLEPNVTYAAGVVKGAKQPDQAREFVAGLTDGGCADALEQAGFGAP